MYKPLNNIEIYIGSPVELDTERVAIRTAVQALESNNRPGIIIANSNFTGKQIDLIVATEDAIYVIEVKGHRLPLKGAVDGDWKLKTNGGGWKPTANFYQQTLKAMHALKDSMYSFNKKMISYPVALLVFVPEIPQGSSIPPSDEKIQIGDVNLIEILKLDKAKVCWDLEVWRDYLGHHNLIKVNSIDEAFHENMAKASGSLSEYEKNFIKEYCQNDKEFVPTRFKIEGEASEYAAVKQIALEDNVLITGPSGCGKSMLVRSLAMEFIRNGTVPIIIEAKYFDAKIHELLDEEVSLLGGQSFRDLQDICSILNRQLVFVIDGLNECAPSSRQRFVRLLKDVASKFQANVVITSQEEGDDLNDLSLKVVEIFRPSLDEKIAIAFKNQEKHIPESIMELLGAADSCLEASLIGGLGSSETVDANRFSIFELYIRKLLEEHSHEGIRLLSNLAQYFSQNLVFSVSFTEYDRILADIPNQASLSKLLMNKNLLKKLGDRVSFGHELFFNVFVVEGLIRASGQNANIIIDAISLPRHFDHKRLIVGSIRNISFLYEVLNKVSDRDVILSCAFGDCGEYAKNWALLRGLEILNFVEGELGTVKFKIDQKGWMNIGIVDASLRAWSPQDLAFIDAIPALVLRGYFVDKFFGLASRLESSLNAAWHELIDEARSLDIKNLKSSLFGVGFVNQNSEISFTRMISRLGLHSFARKESEFVNLAKWIECKSDSIQFSNGELYTILQLAHQIHRRDLFVGAISKAISERWKYLPYHLHMELLDSAQTCGDVSEDQKLALIEGLKGIETSNIFVSSMVLDALKCLNEIDDIGQEQSVRNEIEQVLENFDDPNSWLWAQSIYNSQFDHIFDHVYWVTIENLPLDEKKKLLTMAVRARTDFKMFVSSLIWRLVEFEDQEIAKYIEHWTDYPIELGSMPQESVQVFLVAHIALAKLKRPLSAKSYNGTEFANSMKAIGEVYYWLNRGDLDQETRRSSCLFALDIIDKSKIDDSIRALYICNRSLSLASHHLLENGEGSFLEKVFPENIADIGRRVLKNRDKIKYGDFLDDRESILSYACQIIREFGKIEDVIVLKELADDPNIGPTAVNAIRKIQEER